MFEALIVTYLTMPGSIPMTFMAGRAILAGIRSRLGR